MELQPNRNISESVLHDRRSINLLKSILPDNCVDCSQLQEGGTLPNIDGYLEILDENGIAREKITVQVKHLTYPEKNGKVFYDIPESVYAYAKIHKGELVFFIACDYASRKFYWRNIDTAAIEEFKNKAPTYNFTPSATQLLRTLFQIKKSSKINFFELFYYQIFSYLCNHDVYVINMRLICRKSIIICQ